MNIDYTLWPNTDGNLGNIKVQIPTGIGDDEWPEGDALVGNFVYKDGVLAGFVDTKALTVNDSKSTVINYDYFDIELPFTEGEIAITRGERSKYFNVRYNPINDDNVVITLKYKGCKTVADVKAVDPDYLTNDIVDGVWSEGLGDLESGSMMFFMCSNLTTFDSDLSSLTDGVNMFNSCEKLTSFTSDLSSLTNGSNMFYECSSLTTFTSNLSSLISGDSMFYKCSNITTFDSDLSSLTDGGNMFYICSSLTTFTSNLSSLIKGRYMFTNCTNLTTFDSDLSSLTNGYMMFHNCKLDTDSITYIADTIKDVNGLTNGNTSSDVYKRINIGIANSKPNVRETKAFDEMVTKGWTIYVNGSEYSHSSGYSITTLDENGEKTITPIPYWAKPVQSDEEHAKYVDENGNFYNILGGQFIYGDDLSTYGMFTCEEDAAANMRLTKIEKP